MHPNHETRQRLERLLSGTLRKYVAPATSLPFRSKPREPATRMATINKEPSK
jgi:hypothetical protein